MQPNDILTNETSSFQVLSKIILVFNDYIIDFLFRKKRRYYGLILLITTNVY